MTYTSQSLFELTRIGKVQILANADHQLRPPSVNVVAIAHRKQLTTPGRSSSIASGFSSTGIHSSVSLTRPMILIRGLVDFWMTKMREKATLATNPT
jgi:hypothetical protein